MLVSQFLVQLIFHIRYTNKKFFDSKEQDNASVVTLLVGRIFSCSTQYAIQCKVTCDLEVRSSMFSQLAKSQSVGVSFSKTRKITYISIITFKCGQEGYQSHFIWRIISPARMKFFPTLTCLWGKSSKYSSHVVYYKHH